MGKLETKTLKHTTMKKEKELKELDELTKEEIEKVSHVKNILSQIGKLSREERIELRDRFDKLFWQESERLSTGTDFDLTQYEK
jgi:ElaB/YqjD/DUF883 family membrane-anchored ribosome-binding protein